MIDAPRVACLLGLLLVPLCLAGAAGKGGFLWLVAGAVAWAVSVLLKGCVTLLVESIGARRDSPRYLAAVHGFLSALAELGAAALAFAWMLPRGTAWHAAAFGAGAGGAEVVFALVIGWALSKDEEWQNPFPDPTKAPRHVRWTFVVERSGALLGHVGSRGLIWLAVGGIPWCAIPAVATFAAVDGVATYGVLRNWDWLELSRWRRFYGFVTTVGVLEVLAFVAVSVVAL